MDVIKDIRNSLGDNLVLDIIAQSMYKPNKEKVNTLVSDYLSSQNIAIYGYIVDNQVQGIIVLDVEDKQNIVILNIAVNKCMRCRGIGSKLIDYSFAKLEADVLIAETDDDAVDFYKKYGFEITNLGKKYGDCNRYKCMIHFTKRDLHNV